MFDANQEVIVLYMEFMRDEFTQNKILHIYIERSQTLNRF